MEKHFVFVYGTLKRGYKNHVFMRGEGVEFVGDVITLVEIPLFIDPNHRNRPCLIDLPGIGFCVSGELYEVNEAKLHELDSFERVPIHYKRKLVPVKTIQNKVVDAHVYFNVITENIVLELERHRLLKSYTFAHHLSYVPRRAMSTPVSEASDSPRSDMGGKVRSLTEHDDFTKLGRSSSFTEAMLAKQVVCKAFRGYSVNALHDL
eukprot:Platyproteum_vivax@DN1152_c0_g1_i1.p1